MTTTADAGAVAPPVPDRDDEPRGGGAHAANGGNGPGPAALVRITVRCDTRRVDLAVPGTVALADLLPDLAAEVGALETATAHAGYRLVRGDGVELIPEETLAEQEVLDGDVLVLVIGADEEPPRVYDDIVEAVADTVERIWKPWNPAAARATALITAAGLLGIGAVALGLARDEGAPALVGGAVAAVLLLAVGAVLDRMRGEHQVALVAVWLAVPFAAAGGLAVDSDEPVLRLGMCLAGSGALLTAVLGMVVVSRDRWVLLPAVVVGAAAAACGGVLTAVDDTRPGVALAVVLVVGVIAGALLPLFAVANTGLSAPNPQNNEDLVGDVEPLNPDDVEARVRVGREVSLALGGTVALLVIGATPFVVDLGVSGAVLAGCAAAVLLFRSRRYRTWGEVAIGVGGGVGGLLALIVSAAVLHPDWRPAMAGIGAGLGILLLASLLRTGRTPVRIDRATDLADGGALVALLPLLALASGLADVVRR